MSSQLPRCPTAIAPNNDRGWLGREPTVDEQEVAGWLKRRTLPSRILHVGVGESLLAREFGARVAQGLTRDGAEATNARDQGLNVLVCNKYDVPAYELYLREPFDCIVDVNVRSYACCDVHFIHYMKRMRVALSAGGMLITSVRGLGCLVPTSLPELRRLCPDWRVSADGNVVVMRPGRIARLRDWWLARAAMRGNAG